MHYSRMRTDRSLRYGGVSVQAQSLSGRPLSRGSLSRGLCLGVSVQGSFYPEGVSVQGSLCLGVSFHGGICPGSLCPGGLCLGVTVQEGLCPGGLCPGGSLCMGFCPG